MPMQENFRPENEQISLESQVRKLFRALSMKYHPDASGENADTEKFQLITETWNDNALSYQQKKIG